MMRFLLLGQIRPRPMVEKTDYRDETLERVFMGCSRARCRSSPEGRRVGQRGWGEGGMRGACTRSSRRPSVRCSSRCSLPTLGLGVQRHPHHPLLPLAHRPVRVQRPNTPHCLPSIFRYIYLYKVYHHPMDHVLLIDQVIEVEVNRVRQRSGVLIKKRRYVWIWWMLPLPTDEMHVSYLRNCCLDSPLPPPVASSWASRL